MLNARMDKATQDRIVEGFLLLQDQEGLLIPGVDDYPPEHTCPSCDALLPSAGARCGCDSNFRYWLECEEDERRAMVA